MGTDSIDQSTDINISGSRHFYAKILLFGEYSVFFDSMALSVPFSKFGAGFNFLNNDISTEFDYARRSNTLLKEYAVWLGDTQSREIRNAIDIDSFRQDLEKGLFLESTIPEGYGLGSSGALCAAVFDRYFMRSGGNGSPNDSEGIAGLQKIFAAMENRFHGISSGLDPLICWLGRPVLVTSAREIKMVTLPWHGFDRGVEIFLADTGSPRNTEAQVKHFMKKSSRKQFKDLITRTLIPVVNTCINSLMVADLKSFMEGMEMLSRFQAVYMKEMIPEWLYGIWERGLASGDYYMKLCGSGGGGYLLGFARNMEMAAAEFSTAGIITVPVKEKGW